MAAEDLPEPDRLEGAPHPREVFRLYGHEKPEEEFLRSFNSGRLHHGWLISGPRGVGKATLAWRIARFLLTAPDPNAGGGLFGAPEPPTSLDTSPDDPVSRRMAALAEPRLFLLRRGPNERETALSADIRVDEVRKMKSFFALSAADGGHRVAIIDAADDLNVAGANALLKLLEEPPPRATFLVITHQPHRLLPTIRSRCRDLRLGPLPAEPLAKALEMAGGMVLPEDTGPLAELAGGSVGEAFRLSHLDGLKLYRHLIDLFATMPRMNRTAAAALAESASGKAAEERFDLIVTLIDLFLSRLARAGTLRTLPPEAAPGESDLITRLVPDAYVARAWADVAQSLTLRIRQGKAVNLDPAALLLDSFLKLDETAGSLARR